MRVRNFLLGIGLLFLIAGTLHAQQPGVDCAPVQGQGWTGCAPIYPSQPPAQGPQPQVPQRPTERWMDHWGAIATDFAHKSAGASLDKQSRGDAEQAAIANCQSNGGLNCKVEIAYRNECAAMVVGDKGHNTAPGMTLGEAVQKGMKICVDSGDSNCRDYYSSCSLPLRIQ